MGCGKARAFTATVFPFTDNPTFGLPVVFYAVPPTNPDGPESPFVDRFWDARENWLPPGVGMDPTSFRPYFGPVPDGTVSPLVGSPNQWDAGLSYATWLAGGYSNPNGCVTLVPNPKPQKLRQAQGIISIRPPPRGVTQAQQIQTIYGVVTPGCPGVGIPTVLYATVVGSIDGTDGTYQLLFSGGSAWEYAGTLGSCSGSGVKLTFLWNNVLSSWILEVKRIIGGIVPFVSTSGQCLPFNWIIPVSVVANMCGASGSVVTVHP